MGMFDSDEPFDPDLSSKERWAEVPEPIHRDSVFRGSRICSSQLGGSMKNFGSGSVDRISATKASKLLTLGENGVENLCARRLQVGGAALAALGD
jgi:hypothetical protein